MTDWATDFDHLDPGFVEDPHAVYSRLRDECPVAHTDRYHGVWIPTRYEVPNRQSIIETKNARK